MSSDDITRWLDQARGGDAAAHAALFTSLQRQLHALAEQHLRHERTGHTLQPTAVIHEAWVRLFGGSVGDGEAGDGPGFEGRRHFLRAASGAMRHVLIDHARRRLAEKRGGGHRQHETIEIEAGREPDPAEMLAIHDALDELAELEPDQAEVVQMRYFGGLDVAEVADALDVSTRTVKRRWALARAWLFRKIRER